MRGGHLLIRHAAQTMLLDTGSPVSIGYRPSCHLLDREIPLSRQYQGMTMEQWSETIGVRIDVLLGSDVLGRFAVTIDADAGDVVFDGAPLGRHAGAAPLHTVAGLPTAVIRTAGRKVRALLHTGATVSCLREADLAPHRAVGVVRDYYPGVGEFATELRLVPLMFGDQPVHLECGRLPPTIEAALSPLGLHGIVGTNLLRTFSIGWGPGYSGLFLAPRRQPAAPLGFAPSVAGPQISQP